MSGKFSQSAANLCLVGVCIVGAMGMLRSAGHGRLALGGALMLVGFCFIVSHWIKPPASAQHPPDLAIHPASPPTGAEDKALPPKLPKVTPKVTPPLKVDPALRHPVRVGKSIPPPTDTKPLQGLQDEAIGNFQCAHAPSSLCVLSQSLPSALRFVIFDPVTGAKTELTRIEGPAGYKYNWSLSPDGSTIAAAVWRSNQIKFLSTTKGPTKSLVVKGQGGISALDWAADGRSLWTSSSAATGAEMLANIDLRGEIRSMLEDVDKDVGWAIPSPDGHRVALWEASGSANAWSLQGF